MLQHSFVHPPFYVLFDFMFVRFKRRVVANARRFLLQEHGHKLRAFLPKASGLNLMYFPSVMGVFTFDLFVPSVMLPRNCSSRKRAYYHWKNQYSLQAKSFQTRARDQMWILLE